MIRNVVVVSKPLEPTASKKTAEKFPIQQIELKLAPITATHNGVLVITCAQHKQGPQLTPDW